MHIPACVKQLLSQEHCTLIHSNEKIYFQRYNLSMSFEQVVSKLEGQLVWLELLAPGTPAHLATDCATVGNIADYHSTK